MWVLYAPLILLCLVGLVCDLILAFHRRTPLILPLLALAAIVAVVALALRTRPLPGVVIGCCGLTAVVLLVSRHGRARRGE